MPAPRLAPERVREAEAFAKQAIANERTMSAASVDDRTVGVAPLLVVATDTALAPLAYGLADLLMTDLAQSRQVIVVDRLRLDAVLRELQLVGGGRVDSATAPRVGRLIMARRLVVGSLDARPGGSIGINARIADAVSGEVRGGVSASATLGDILAAEKELAFRLLASLGVNLTPAERAAIERRPTASLVALLAYSKGVEHETYGRFADAAREYRRAVRIDPGFTRAAAREQAVQPATVPAAETGAMQIERAATVATERVNASANFTPARPAGGVADPGSPVSQNLRTITIMVIITTPP